MTTVRETLRFATNDPRIDVIRVRSFDTATFLAFGAAHLAIAGSDVLMEFEHSEIYAPVDLAVAPCRLMVAAPAELAARDDPRQWSHVRVATKYPNVTKRHFAARGVQAECIRLNGAGTGPQSWPLAAHRRPRTRPAPPWPPMAWSRSSISPIAARAWRSIAAP